MLDVKFIRENTAKVKTRLAMRGKSYDEEIDQILALDDERRAIIGKVESQKAEQKRISKSIPQLKKNADTTPVGGARDWTFFFDYIHNIVIKVFNFLALVTDMVIDKFVQILQWMVCSLVFIVGDGLRSLQVRNVRLQVALSIAGVAVIGIVVYLCGGLS